MGITSSKLSSSAFCFGFLRRKSSHAFQIVTVRWHNYYLIVSKQKFRVGNADINCKLWFARFRCVFNYSFTVVLLCCKWKNLLPISLFGYWSQLFLLFHCFSVGKNVGNCTETVSFFVAIPELHKKLGLKLSYWPFLFFRWKLKYQRYSYIFDNRSLNIKLEKDV